MPLDYQNPGVSGGQFDWSSLFNGISPIAGGLTNLIAGNNATQQLSGAIGSVIPQQQGVYGQVAGQYSPYTNLGRGAAGGLGSFLGLPGSQPFNSSTLNNFPGLNFLTNIGNTAIRNQASAKGSLYTPGTMAYLANYDQGLGLSNAINPYLNTLLSSAGYGMQGAQGTAQGALTTGNNTGQALIGRGSANASGAAASATPINSILQGGEGLLKNYLGGGNNPFSNMFGGGGGGIGGADSSGFDLFNGMGGGGYTGAGSSLSNFDIGMQDISGGLNSGIDTGLSNFADQGISSLGDLFPGASGQAATAGIGGGADLGAQVGTFEGATGPLDNAALAGYSASDAGAAGGAGLLGALAGPALFAGIMGYGMSQPAFTKNGDFYNRMNSYIKAGPGQFASPNNPGGPGFNGLYWDPQYADYTEAQQALGLTPTPNYRSYIGGGGGGGSNLSNK